MKHVTLLILSLLSFNAYAAPVGFGDAEVTLKPPVERDYCIDPVGAADIDCLTWQPLPSNEISHYEITRDNNVFVATVPHVINYVDNIFADIILPWGINNLEAVTYDTEGRVSKAKTFTVNMVMPTGDPKLLPEFSVKQKPLP